MKCPFSCSQHGTIPDCARERCMMADGAGDCFIKQALQLYVSGERTKRAEEEERLRRETEAAMAYWKMHKDGTRTPIQFLKNEGASHTPLYSDGRPKTIIEIERGDPLPENVPTGTVVVEKY